MSGARVNTKDNKWLTPLHRACCAKSEVCDARAIVSCLMFAMFSFVIPKLCTCVLIFGILCSGESHFYTLFYLYIVNRIQQTLAFYNFIFVKRSSL